MRIIGLFVCGLLLFASCKTTKKTVPVVETPPVTEIVETPINEDEINWISWEEAVKANEKTPKKIFIDVYTDWCGWCKKMDQTTFKDTKVVVALNRDFYAVKFDAEQKEVIKFKDKDYVFESKGRRGAHQLAKALLDGRMGYPSMVYLDENLNRIMPSPGFKTANDLLREIGYISTNAYTKIDFVKFSGE